MKKRSSIGFLRLGFKSLCCVLILLAVPAQAQIPHGGTPLALKARTGNAEQKFLQEASGDAFIEMPKFDADSARAIDDLPDNRVGGLRFAHAFHVNLRPENSGLVFHDENGNIIWRVGIRSQGAYSLSVFFSSFDLPEGAKLFVYSSDLSTILGGFTQENRPGGGTFSVAPIESDEIIVEYQEPADASFHGNIEIAGINHDYRGLLRKTTNFGYDFLPCIPNVTCNEALNTISRSVCLLIVNGINYATGTFVNNTAQDGKLYLLTASHCLGNSAAMGERVVAYMHYASPNCDTRIKGSEEFTLSGTVTRAISSDIDFALLEFLEDPPSDYRPYLAGWNIKVDTIQDAPFTAIHHPNGDVMRYSVELDTLHKADFVDFSKIIQKGNHWGVDGWDIGHTWGGSSGGALFDKNFRVVGALTGGRSGGMLGCDSSIQGDFFYRLERAWRAHPQPSAQLQHWLDPLAVDSTSGSKQLDGLDLYADQKISRISNVSKNDSMDVVRLPSPATGPMFGHNSLHTSYFAEHFTVPDTSMILGVYLVAGHGTYKNNKPVNVQVFEGGPIPGRLLGRSVLQPEYLDYSRSGFISKRKKEFGDRENYLRFDSAVYGGKDFYIGYTITYPVATPADTFSLYAALREPGSPNTSFFKDGSGWHPASEHPLHPISTALWIEPVLCKNTILSPKVYTVKRPVVSWSQTDRLLYFAFPEQWTGKTQVVAYDVSGRRAFSANVVPPIDVLTLPESGPRILLIRISNGSMSSIHKVAVGS